MQVLILLVTVPLTFVTSQHCNYPYSQPHFKIHGHVIKAVSGRTRIHCKKECGDDAGCHSINYYGKTETCELNNANHLSNPESLVPEASSEYNDFPARAVQKCSDGLCSDNERCQPHGNGYRCLSCEDQQNKQVLNFPRKGVEDKVLVDNAFGPLTTFSLALWSRPNASSFPHTLVSHATSAGAEGISIFLHKDFTEFGVMNLAIRSAPSVLDDKWHHLCFTWQSSDGQYYVYIDGTLSQTGTTRKGYTIDKGAFMLGQDQDGYKSGLDPNQSLQGLLTSVNLWDRVLTSQEVSALAKSCPTTEGNILSWSTLKQLASGEVKLVCSWSCLGPR